MCEFCSAITKGNGKLILFDWEQRQKLLKDNPKNYTPDSHASIAHFFKLNEDKVNKYEYNPLTKEFIVDQINIKDDSALAKRNFEQLNWKTIVELLIIKPIINPLTDVKEKKVTKKDINNLKKWSSVGDSVRYSVRYSVWSSVRYSVWNSVWSSVWGSVWDSVWGSVWDSVWDSVGASVGDSVWYSVRDSVGDSVGNSVGDSVGAYISSFFDIKYEYDFKSLIELWERGFVPSFDGKIWRLHQGKDAKTVYKIGK